MAGTSKTEDLLIRQGECCQWKQDRCACTRVCVRDGRCVCKMFVRTGVTGASCWLVFWAQPEGEREGWLASVIRCLWSFAHQRDKHLTPVSYLSFLPQLLREALLSLKVQINTCGCDIAHRDKNFFMLLSPWLDHHLFRNNKFGTFKVSQYYWEAPVHCCAVHVQ